MFCGGPPSLVHTIPHFLEPGMMIAKNSGCCNRQTTSIISITFKILSLSEILSVLYEDSFEAFVSIAWAVLGYWTYLWTRCFCNFVPTEMIEIWSIHLVGRSEDDNWGSGAFSSEYVWITRQIICYHTLPELIDYEIEFCTVTSAYICSLHFCAGHGEIEHFSLYEIWWVH